MAGQPIAVDTKLSMDGTTLRLDPLDLGLGKSKVNGQVSIATGKARPNYSFKLAATTLALADVARLGAAPPGKPVEPAASGVRSRFVFSDSPIDLSALRSADVTGELAAETLLLTDGSKLDHAHLQFSLQNGVLDAPTVRGGILGGTLVGRATLDASRERNGALDLHVEAKGLELSAILAEAGTKRDVRGGKTTLNADITARGTSLHQWAASASGNVLVTVGTAALGHGSDNGDAAFNRLADAVNPFRKVDSSTELQCAVIRLPLAGGIAKVDRSIGVETNKIGANASGTLDFRNETLDLSIRPQIRKGIALNIDSIASLVRFHGPFKAPIVGVDAMASAATVATIGAALSTGGISLLGQSLLSSAVADPGAPCQIALGRGGSAPSDAAATPRSPTPAQELGNALGKFFKH